jgi:hypothetical protein
MTKIRIFAKDAHPSSHSAGSSADSALRSRLLGRLLLALLLLLMVTPGRAAAQVQMKLRSGGTLRGYIVDATDCDEALKYRNQITGGLLAGGNGSPWILARYEHTFNPRVWDEHVMTEAAALVIPKGYVSVGARSTSRREYFHTIANGFAGIMLKPNLVIGGGVVLNFLDQTRHEIDLAGYNIAAHVDVFPSDHLRLHEAMGIGWVDAWIVYYEQWPDVPILYESNLATDVSILRFHHRLDYTFDMDWLRSLGFRKEEGFLNEIRDFHPAV